MGPVALLLTAQAPAFGQSCIRCLRRHRSAAWRRRFNLHTMLPAIYGAKLLVNVLFVYRRTALMQPSRRILLLIALVWLVSVGEGH